MRSAAPTRRTAEAAQANLGGLECSSYTWQVRHCEDGASGPDCQGPPAPTKHDPSAGFEKSHFIYNALTILALAPRVVIQPSSGSE